MKNYLNKHFAERKSLYAKYKSLLDVLLFIIITYGAHQLWWGNIDWITSFAWMGALRDFMTALLFDQSYWFVSSFLYEINYQHTTLLFANNGYIEINHSCAGVKQFYQLFVLFLLFPGPWKHKLWYIPMSMFIMHFVNVFRIIALSVVVVEWPEVWHFAHDWVLRPFFYVVIFALWVIWNDKIRKQAENSEPLSVNRN